MAIAAASLAAWVVLVGACLHWGVSYERTPGNVGTAPPRCPDKAAPMHAPGRACVFVSLHPRCPCSDASVAALSEFVAKTDGAGDVIVLVGVPRNAHHAWTASATATAAARIPGVRVVLDTDGAVAASLGMMTSGHAVAYDAHGGLLYSGGVTAGRGVIGPSACLTALISAIKTGHAASAHTSAPVFGCPLVAPQCPTQCPEEQSP